MTFTLVRSVPDAEWLPRGSSAEMWAGEGEPPSPAIIVRLLAVRHSGKGREFFCIPTAKGDDLPTLFLGRGVERRSIDDGLHALTRTTLGDDHASVCVGYVRNHVPHADASYPHPVPDAYVPIFRVDGAELIVPGSWRHIGEATDLEPRHWFPIVYELLAHNVS